jgi:hypothetical protein
VIRHSSLLVRHPSFVVRLSPFVFDMTVRIQLALEDL